MSTWHEAAEALRNRVMRAQALANLTGKSVILYKNENSEPDVCMADNPDVEMKDILEVFNPIYGGHENDKD